MKTLFTSAALFALLPIALLSSCDRSVSTVSSGNGSVAVVPRFAAASVPAASRLEARLSATGQSDSVVNVAYQKGGDLELGSVPSGASFTVNMTGYDSVSTSTSRIYRWAGSGSGTADNGSATKYVDISTTSGPVVPSLVIGGTVVPQTLPLAGMWYTIDGTDPRLVSKATKATEDVKINSACTVRAARDTVIAGDTLWSDTVSWTFTAAPSPVTTVAAPIFSVAGGTYASAQKVALSSTASGANIYYTTNGAAPTSSSTLYTGSLTVSASETIQAVAVLNGVSSEVTSETYTITPVTPTKQQFKLTVSPLSGGTVTLSPAGSTFDSGTSVTATATANSGYTFSGWTGACTGTTSPCTVTMTKDTTLSANFAVAASTDTTLSGLSVSAGKLTPSFSSKTLSYHDTVGSTATSETITASATATGATVGGAGFVSLSSLSAGGSVTKTVTVTNGTKSLVYTVVIVKRALPKYKLTVGGSVSGGTVSLSLTGPTFDSGTVVTATATAKSGYTFSGWTGAYTGTSSSCKVTMTKDTTLNANFAAAVTLSSLSVSVGKLSPSFAPETLIYHDTVALTATSETITATAPATGATVSGTGIVSWKYLYVGDSVMDTVMVKNGTNSRAYVVAIVRHKPPSYRLTLQQSMGGTISLALSDTIIDSGLSELVVAKANSGYEFSGWTGACSGVTSSSCWVTMTKDKSLSAIFVATSGTLTDSRDGQTYKYVKIGSQTWMAQNLNYKVDSSWCYGGDASNCATYGRLYKWAAVMDLASTYSSTTWGGDLPHQGVCPSGWHVPSDAEWQTLEVSVGMSAETAATADWRGTTEGTKLKANSSLWSTNTGTDAYGFSVLPAGYNSYDETFYYLGDYAYFWSSSEYNASIVLGRGFGPAAANVYRCLLSKSDGHSLRCVRN